LAERDLERENRTLERRLKRLESNVRQLEDFQDANSRVLSTVMQELEAERARSRQLLLNVLPDRIVARLEQGEQPIADRHDEVAVLFSDFAGFTAIAARLEPTVLIAELNELFAGFDGICGRLGVEPIKTIGDAYLGIGGLAGGVDGAIAVADAALAMCGFVSSRTSGAADWRVRIGLHIGRSSRASSARRASPTTSGATRSTSRAASRRPPSRGEPMFRGSWPTGLGRGSGSSRAGASTSRARARRRRSGSSGDRAMPTASVSHRTPGHVACPRTWA
jgi:class 3 adenylate cyclase